MLINPSPQSDADPQKNDSIVRRAQAFAENAHGSIGHLRKYTEDPYTIHLHGVAELVASVPHTEAMVAAAFLHDVVEDVASVKISDIENAFGKEVASLVCWLTDVSIGHPGNRRIRKTLDREHIERAPAEAQTIKLADIIDNAASIRAGDPKFWVVYQGECLQLLSVLSKGDPVLRQRAASALIDNL
ncbi:HD domain-containing protein [Aminobacter aminovorans]|uniref:GTP pyrophosphokinase rsh n=1 Tax=Aminobacter aminovorans TaxID=83263 RepID=A0A380WPK8_AMIAI|nr:HD domain-containing protein [Aminobacter aminovorans]TCS29886.1 HD domain-containing protein [Aminobacter aminovorans]SUU90735.1 GTP pyrophosphokinase rsh [Aminobacter aminovorans]